MRNRIKPSSTGAASRAAASRAQSLTRILPAGIVIHCRFKERRGGRALHRRSDS